MREIIVSIFGQYTPQVDPVSGAAVLGVAGCDWEWLAGVLLFAIVLFCFMKLLGCFLK